MARKKSKKKKYERYRIEGRKEKNKEKRIKKEKNRQERLIRRRKRMGEINEKDN